MTLATANTKQTWRRIAIPYVPMNSFRITVILNCVSLFLLTLWIATDPSAERSISVPVETWLHGNSEGMATSPQPKFSVWNAGPLYLVSMTFASLLAMAGILLLGVAKQSRLGRWLFFVTLCAAWLGLINGVHDLAWFGKRLRFANCVPSMQRLADRLQEDWPKNDGTLDVLGPFMAYPVYEPRTLLLLTPPRLQTWDEHAISVVERATDGGLRFQLADTNRSRPSNRNDWIEWHPAPILPSSFTGGLSDRHQLQQTTSLGDGWFLSRYESPKRIEESSIRREKLATHSAPFIDFD